MTTYILRDGKLIEKPGNKPRRGLEIVSDIQPYKSMIDGSRIGSRSTHRTHLRDHNCIEVGNEKMETKLALPSSEGRRKVLREQLSNMTDRQANDILARVRNQRG